MFLRKTTLLLILAMFTSPQAWADLKLDRSKAFAYTLPDGWEVRPSPVGGHDLIASVITGGKSRTILIVDQPGTNPLEEVKSAYERDLAKFLKEFALLSSGIIALKNGALAVRLIHTNTTPGVPIRQIAYILEVAKKRYFITCTVPESEGDKYDKVFESFIDSMVAPKIQQ